MQIFFIIAVAAIVIGLVLWGQQLAAKRRMALRNWAVARGLSFSGASDYSMENAYPFFSCLTKGDNRYAYNVIKGDYQGRPVCAFDYHYQTYSSTPKGQRQTHHHQFSAVVPTTDVPLKPLSIRAETLFDKIGSFFGHEDINFESAEFSREFCVTSPDRRWAFDVLNQPSMEFLLAAPRFTLEFGGLFAMAYRDGTFSVLDFEAALDVIVGLIGRIPKNVLDELKGAP